MALTRMCACRVLSQPSMVAYVAYVIGSNISHADLLIFQCNGSNEVCNLVLDTLPWPGSTANMDSWWECRIGKYSQARTTSCQHLLCTVP